VVNLSSLPTEKIVSEMTIGEFEDMTLSLDVSDEYRYTKAKREKMLSKMRPTGLKSDAYNEFSATPLSHFYGSKWFLNIDVNHDDKAISEGVLGAVRRRRKEIDRVEENLDNYDMDTVEAIFGQWPMPRINNPFDDRAFANWYIYGVLPYWDLKTWSELAGVKLTLEEASLKIWPDGFGNADTIRKTTKKYVNSVITFRSLYRLKALSI
jgi:hypothetical protein